MAPEPTLGSVKRGGGGGAGFHGRRTSKGADGVDIPDSERCILKCDIHCELSWVWNKGDRSDEACVKEEDGLGTGVTFHPVWSNGTAGIRGSRPLIGSFNYWEIHVGKRMFGTSLMFGVSTKDARLHADSFVDLLGEDSHGWGLSHRGRVYHGGESRYYCKPFQEHSTVVVGVLLDRARGQLSFFKNGQNLGVAFTDLNLAECDLYPTVCSTAAKTTMAIGRRQRSFIDLQDRCRHAVATSIGIGLQFRKGDNESVKKKLDKLPLPTKMKRYVLDL